MGTSVSQGSAQNTNWNPVFAGYRNKFIPENRIVNEIWRASENDDVPLSASIKSNMIYECFSTVQQSNNFSEALNRFNASMVEFKGNSIVAECARRVIPAAFQSNNPAKDWLGRFFQK